MTTKKVWLLDRQTDGQTDAGQSNPYVPLCFADDTKTGPQYPIALFATMLSRRNKNRSSISHYPMCRYTLQLGPKGCKIVAAFQGMHVSPAKHSYAWPPRKCDYRTDRQTDRQMPDKAIPMCHYALQTTQKQVLSIPLPYLPLCFPGETKIGSVYPIALWDPRVAKIVAAFRGMHVSPAKHSYAWLPRKCDH